MVWPLESALAQVNNLQHIPSEEQWASNKEHENSRETWWGKEWVQWEEEGVREDDNTTEDYEHTKTGKE